jgi:Kef-type K+ transport system membrane component KefB
MVPKVSFGSLVVVAAIAVAAPMLVGFFPRVRVPAVVLEIVAGIVVGPHGFGWVRIDLPVQILAIFGLAFLLFLAGLEIDVERLRGRLLRLAGAGFALTMALGLVAGFAFNAVGWVRSPLLLAIALSATSLGLVVPVLKDAGQAATDLGQQTIAASSVADFAAVVLLTLFFSTKAASTDTKVILLAGFVIAAVVATLALLRLNRAMNLTAVLTRLQDTTAEIRVRIAVLLLVAFVALAERLGLETILGAFLAGAILNFVDRDATGSHPNFRLKLEAIGYGFLVPVFFVTSGLRFDLDALLASPSAFARVPLFLLALLVVRGVPAALYVRSSGRRRAAAAGLLQATSLPFIVTATEIGVILGQIRPVNGAALVGAALMSVVLFPPIALSLLKGDGEGEGAAGAGESEGEEPAVPPVRGR